MVFSFLFRNDLAKAESGCFKIKGVRLINRLDLNRAGVIYLGTSDWEVSYAENAFN